MYFTPLIAKETSEGGVCTGATVIDRDGAIIVHVANLLFAETAVAAINAQMSLANGTEPSDDDTGWTWAIVEVMAHRKHVGRVREEEKFGAKLLRVDEPMYVGKRESATYPYKVVDLTLDRWETHYYPGNALFSFTPTSKATALKIREREATIAAPAQYQLEDNSSRQAVEHEDELGDDFDSEDTP